MKKLKRMKLCLRSKPLIFPSLRIALGAACLMSVSGCAEMKQWPQNLAQLDSGQKAPAVKLDATLRVAPKEPSCLDPGKKEYEVKELEEALACREAYAKKLRSRFNSLARASEATEK